MEVHLPGMHRVVFNQTETLDNIIARAAHQQTKLTGFFACCASDEFVRALTYQEFPQKYVWNIQEKIWTPRKQGYSIGRMYFVSPNSDERFYLRLLLTMVKGPTSFENLRTVNDILYDTFKSACVARGLLEDDEEWIQCLDEAATMKTGYQLRRLFAIILTECTPTFPVALWNRFSMDICDNLPHKIRTLFRILSPTEDQIKDYGLYMLNQLLQESDKSLADFLPMPLSVSNWNVVVGNRLLLGHQRLQNIAQ